MLACDLTTDFELQTANREANQRDQGAERNEEAGGVTSTYRKSLRTSS